MASKQPVQAGQITAHITLIKDYIKDSLLSKEEKIAQMLRHKGLAIQKLELYYAHQLTLLAIEHMPSSIEANDALNLLTKY